MLNPPTDITNAFMRYRKASSNQERNHIQQLIWDSIIHNTEVPNTTLSFMDAFIESHGSACAAPALEQIPTGYFSFLYSLYYHARELNKSVAMQRYQPLQEFVHVFASAQGLFNEPTIYRLLHSRLTKAFANHCPHLYPTDAFDDSLQDIRTLLLPADNPELLDIVSLFFRTYSRHHKLDEKLAQNSSQRFHLQWHAEQLNWMTPKLRSQWEQANQAWIKARTSYSENLKTVEDHF